MEMLLKKIYGSQLQSYSKIKVSLPMYLTEEKEFYEATIFDVKFIIVKNKSIERLNVVVLKKHIQKYYEHFNENIVSYVNSITNNILIIVHFFSL